MTARSSSNQAVALVTGASSGIGLEMARQLASRQRDLVIVARSQGKLESLAQELKGAFGVRVHVIASDLAKPGAARQLHAAINELGLEVEVLVNNAGVGVYGQFLNTDATSEQEMIQLNVAALTELTKLFVPPMVDRGHGRILNVASTAAFQPGPLMAVYFATKAYVLSFSEALAEELSGTGVTVTTLCPGATSSGFQAVAAMERSKLIKDKHLATSQEVARQGIGAMERGERVFVPGLKNRMLAGLAPLMPRSLATKVVKRLQAEA